MGKSKYQMEMKMFEEEIHVDEYLKNFNIEDYLDKFILIPQIFHTTSPSRDSGDDIIRWSISEKDFTPDPYFITKKLFELPNNSTLWTSFGSSGYIDLYLEALKAKENGDFEIWELQAKEIQENIRENVRKNYNRYEHKRILKIIYDNELFKPTERGVIYHSLYLAREYAKKQQNYFFGIHLYENEIGSVGVIHLDKFGNYFGAYTYNKEDKVTIVKALIVGLIQELPIKIMETKEFDIQVVEVSSYELYNYFPKTGNESLRLANERNGEKLEQNFKDNSN